MWPFILKLLEELTAKLIKYLPWPELCRKIITIVETDAGGQQHLVLDGEAYSGDGQWRQRIGLNGTLQLPRKHCRKWINFIRQGRYLGRRKFYWGGPSVCDLSTLISEDRK